MRRVRIPTFSLGLAMLGAALSPSAVPAARAADSAAATNPLAAEIQAKAGGDLKRFYASRGFQPLWVANGAIGLAAAALLDDLETADLDGLKPSSYKPKALREAIAAAATGDPRALARAELALSAGFARYVRDLRKPGRGGETLYADPSLKPRKLSAETVLRAAALVPSFADYTARMGWMSPHYARIRALMARAVAAGADRQEIARIRLNLDRARILPGAWVHHIVVDAGSARLWYYQAGKEAGTMKVVVGTSETQTPMLAGSLQWAILNPYWNVPTYLARKSVAHKVLAGRSLKTMGMEALSDWSENAVKLDERAVDWNAVASGAQEIRVRQLPGRLNSMGRVKFLFPNDEGIYLHDTPDRDLFAKDDRHLSNGCIRLEDAQRLGKWLLGRAIPPPSAKKPDQDVALPVPVPVYLTYFTIAQTDRGIAFRDDIYGRDGKR